MRRTRIKILSVSHSDGGSGSGRAAYRIHTAIEQTWVDSQMLVKNKVTKDNKVVAIDAFKPKNTFYNIWSYFQNKTNNKLQQYRWKKYPEKEKVFMSDLRSIPLHGALQKIDFDILHLHWINLRFINLTELLKINKPVIWTLHDCWPFTGICHYPGECESFKKSCGKCPLLHSRNPEDLSNKVWKFKNKLYANLDLHIVTPSNWLAKIANGSSLFDKIPVNVIPNCIDTEIFIPGDRSSACNLLGLDPNNKIILFGAFNAINDKRKGFEYLKLALEMLINYKDFKNAVVVIFGADPIIELPKISFPIINLGLLDSNEDLIYVYQSADVLVVPSVSENLSNIIMEGMSCGTPVVAYNIGGNSDLIEHKTNGYLSKPFDTFDLGNGIKWCIENNSQKKISENARHKVITEYRRDLIANKYIDLYKEVKLHN